MSRDASGTDELLSPSFPLEELPGGITVVRVAPLEAALPGTLAAFSTRRGGVSSPPWDRMNVGLHVGDSPVAVAENRRRLFRALGVDPEALATAAQVHGAAVGVASSPGRHEGVDALVSVARGLTLAILCADCAPIWLLDPARGAVGLVHSGWRGALEDVAGRTVQAMARKLGSRPRDLWAAVGPCLGPCCYEVGADVAGPAERRLGPDVLVAGEDGKVRFDLREACRRSLVLAGLNPSRVYTSGLCTSCRADLFHSYRREFRRYGSSARVGRMAALLRLPAGR